MSDKKSGVISQQIYDLLINPYKILGAGLDVQDYIKKLSAEFGIKIAHPIDLYEIDDDLIRNFLWQEIKSYARTSFVADFASSFGGPAIAIGGTVFSIGKYLKNLLEISQKVAIATGIAPDPLKPGISYEVSFEELYPDFLEILAYGLGTGGVREVTKRVTQQLAEKKAKDIIRKRIQDELVTRLAKKIAEALGVRLTKAAISRTILKALPVIGGCASGIIGYKAITDFGDRALDKAFNNRNSLREHVEKRKLERIDIKELNEVQFRIEKLRKYINIENISLEGLSEILEKDEIIVKKALESMKNDNLE